MRIRVLVIAVVAIAAVATGVVVLHRSRAEPTQDAAVPPTPVVAGTVTAHPVPMAAIAKRPTTRTLMRIGKTSGTV